MKLVAFNAFDMRSDLDLLITRSDSPVLIEATDSAVRFRYPDESENLFGGTILYDTSPPQEPNDVFIGESYFSLFKQFNSQKVLFYSIANLDLAGATYDQYLDSYDGGDIDSSRKLSQFILRGKDTIIGSPGADYLLGYEGDDKIKGDSGNDTLDGGTGADKMWGGLGNDTYVVDNRGDFVIELANQGNDTVLSSITYTLGANVENLTLTGSGVINGTGNGLNNVLTGNSEANLIDGGNGNDSLNGGGGNDRLIGGNGNDNLNGGAGADTLTGIALNDTTLGRGSIDVLTGGTENDFFVLGNASSVFYSDGLTATSGRSDYAHITDFTSGDKIELKGRATDYILRSNDSVSGNC